MTNPNRRPGFPLSAILCSSLALLAACESDGVRQEVEPSPTAVALQPAPAPFSGYRTARHGGNYMQNYYLPPAPSSTPWAPAWSPDGGSLAVGMSGSIWSVDVETGVATELTHGSRYHSSPDWSPDGRWIVYTSHGEGTVGLEILDVETGEMHKLTDDEWIYADPVFSPDGTRIAYVSTKPSGYFNIYVRNIQGGALTGEEVAISRDNDFGRNRLYFGRWDMHLSPAWMPDGTELLLVSNRDVALGSGNVVRAPVKPDGIAEARTVLQEQTLYRARPHVSPDGTRFLVSSTRGSADQFNNLYLQPSEGGEPYKLTYFQHDAFHPRWSPDGKWIAFVSNEHGTTQLELLETFGGLRKPLAITERQYSRPMGSLSVTVLEDGDAEPTGARITLFASDGKAWAPTDAYARVGQRANVPAFHTEGPFSIELPIGEADLTVMKGFEREPQRHRVAIAAGEETELTVRLKRMDGIDLTGWVNGSTHVHMNYGGNLHNTLENLMMMSRAEGQDIVNELIANKDNRMLDHQFFLPGAVAHPVSTPDQIMAVGQEYRPDFFGHVFMLGLKDHFLTPNATGYEATAIHSLYPSNTDMLKKAKEQGAITGYVHPFTGSSDPLGQGLGRGRSLMVDAPLGLVDCLEWTSSETAGFFPLYALWNNGIRVAATGGEDSISDLHWMAFLGAMRTYVKTLDGELSIDGWMGGLKRGHSFVTNGPLLSLTVNGQVPGSQLELTAGGGEVEVVARMRSIVPLTRVWLVADGVEVMEVPLAEDRKSASLEAVIPVETSGWIHLLAEGDGAEGYPLDASYPQAFTNPVWFSVAGAPVRDLASAEYGLQWVDTLEVRSLAMPGWRSQAEIDHVLGQFEEAREVYRRLAQEARD